jgi:hypothetical protein
LKRKLLLAVTLIATLTLSLLPTTHVSAADPASQKWVLAETINPAGGSGIVIYPESDNPRREGTYVKMSVDLAIGEMILQGHGEAVDIETGEKLPPVDSINRIFFDSPPQELTPGDTVSLNVVQGEGTSDGLFFFGAYDPRQFEGKYLFDYSRWTEYKSFDKQYDPKPWSFNFIVPDIYEGELRIRFSNYQRTDLFVEWVYRPSDGPKLELHYSNPLDYFESDTGVDLGFAGELIATLKDENSKPVKGKTIVFFIDKEFPTISEPGKNLFDVLDYRTKVGGGLIPRMEESHPYLKKKILDPELDPSLFNENRIFIGGGIKTDSNGEAIINLIQYDILDPRKFSSELLPQRATFLDEGKISGTIIAGVYDEETKLLTRKTSLEIEYKAIAKILQITGDGRPDDTDIGKKYPGKVRVKRPVMLPHFEYQPVEEGFLLLPGDVVDIDGNCAVEIAWINGDKVIAKVPPTIKIGTVRELYEPPESQIWILSSAYDSGFLSPGEKIVNSVTFGFGVKKGIELLVESIPWVGKALKEGGALIIEIQNGLQDIDLSQSDIVTRNRIRSKVIIDYTGEEVKVYNLEGSPDIKTVKGGEVTLEQGKMVTVSEEGNLSEIYTFNVKDIEKEFYETVPTIQPTINSGSKSKSSSSPLGLIIGIVAVIVVPLMFLVMRKRFKKT